MKDLFYSEAVENVIMQYCLPKSDFLVINHCAEMQLRKINVLIRGIFEEKSSLSFFFCHNYNDLALLTVYSHCTERFKC